MSNRDWEFINPLDLFPGSAEPIEDVDPLPARMRANEGEPLARIDQLVAQSLKSDEEPRLRLEYDRFAPAFRAQAKK